MDVTTVGILISSSRVIIDGTTVTIMVIMAIATNHVDTTNQDASRGHTGFIDIIDSTGEMKATGKLCYGRGLSLTNLSNTFLVMLETLFL